MYIKKVKGKRQLDNVYNTDSPIYVMAGDDNHQLVSGQVCSIILRKEIP